MNNWTQILGTLTKISAGSYNNLWGFNSQGSLYQYQPWLIPLCAPHNRCSVWNEAHSDLRPVNISAGFDQTAWAIDQSGNVWRYDATSNSFVQVGSGMKSIAVASDAVIWALDTSGNIYRYW